MDNLRNSLRELSRNLNRVVKDINRIIDNNIDDTINNTSDNNNTIDNIDTINDVNIYNSWIIDDINTDKYNKQQSLQAGETNFINNIINNTNINDVNNDITNSDDGNNIYPVPFMQNPNYIPIRNNTEIVPNILPYNNYNAIPNNLGIMNNPVNFINLDNIIYPTDTNDHTDPNDPNDLNSAYERFKKSKPITNKKYKPIFTHNGSMNLFEFPNDIKCLICSYFCMYEWLAIRDPDFYKFFINID